MPGATFGPTVTAIPARVRGPGVLPPTTHALLLPVVRDHLRSAGSNTGISASTTMYAAAGNPILMLGFADTSADAVTALGFVDATGANLINNNDFETDVSGWQAVSTATLTRSTTRGKTGSSSMQIATSAFVSGEGARYIDTGPGAAVAASTFYTFSAWFLSVVAGNPQSIQLKWDEYDSGSVFIQTLVGPTIAANPPGSTSGFPTNANSQYIMAGKTSSTTAFLRPYVVTTSTPGISAGQFWMDAVELRAAGFSMTSQVAPVNKGTGSGNVEVWAGWASPPSTSLMSGVLNASTGQANVIVVGYENTASGSILLPIGATASATGSSTTASVNLTTTRAGSRVVAFLGLKANAAVTPGAGIDLITTQAAVDTTSSQASLLERQGVVPDIGTVVTISATFTSAAWGIVAVEILPVSPFTIFTLVLSAAQSSVATVGRLTNKLLPFAQPQVATLTRQTNKIFALTQAQPVTLTRQVGKTLTAAQAQVATLVSLAIHVVTLTVAQTQVATLIRRTNKTLSATQAQVATLPRSINKTLALAQAQVATLLRTTNKTFSATQAQVATLVASRLFLTTLTAAQAQVAALSRQVGKNLTATQAQVATLPRLVFKTLGVAQVQVAMVTKQSARRFTATQAQVATLVASQSQHFLNLTLSQPQVVVVSTLVNKTLGAVQTLLPSLQKDTLKVFSATQAQVATLARVFRLAPPVNTVAPTITTDPINVGIVLSVTSNGTWTGQSIAYTYRWQRDDGRDGIFTDIPGATASSYTIVGQDRSHMLRAIVTATNSGAAIDAPSNEVSMAPHLFTEPTGVITLAGIPKSSLVGTYPGSGTLPG